MNRTEGLRQGSPRGPTTTIQGFRCLTSAEAVTLLRFMSILSWWEMMRYSEYFFVITRGCNVCLLCRRANAEKPGHSTPPVVLSVYYIRYKNSARLTRFQ